MSSTSKTANIGLPQWEASDTVEREDFNEALAKIDEAFVRLPRQKLFDIEVTEERLYIVELDLSEIDLDQFAEIDIFADIKEEYMEMRLNKHGSAGDYDANDRDQESKIIVYMGSGTIYNMKDRFRYVSPCGPNLGNALKTVIPTIQTIQFYAPSGGSYFSVGDKISVWGVLR